MPHILSESFLMRFKTPALRKKYIGSDHDMVSAHVVSRKKLLSDMFCNLVKDGLPYGMNVSINVSVFDTPRDEVDKPEPSEKSASLPTYIHDHIQVIAKSIKDWNVMKFGQNFISITQLVGDITCKVTITYEVSCKGSVPEIINLPKTKIGKFSLPAFQAVGSNNNVIGNVEDQLSCFQLTSYVSYQQKSDECTELQFNTSEGGPRVVLRVGKDIDLTATHGYLINLVHPGITGLNNNLFEHICEDKIDQYELPPELRGVLKIMRSSRMEKILANCMNMESMSHVMVPKRKTAREMMANALSLLIVGHESNIFLRYNDCVLADMCSFVDRLAERRGLEVNADVVVKACTIFNKIYLAQGPYTTPQPISNDPSKYEQSGIRLLSQLQLIDREECKAGKLLPTFFGRVVGRTMSTMLVG